MYAKSQKYISEDIARRVAGVSFTRISNEFGKDNCKMYDDGKSVVIEYPNKIDGNVVVRYSW